MNQSPPHSIPHEPGRWRALTLAAVVHVALFAFLWFGIRWQNEKPVTVEAEIWSPNAQEAAPLAVQKIPEPQPEPPIEKAPEKAIEKPVPEPVPEPKPVVETPPVAKPDIALEQEKKRKIKIRQEQEDQRAEDQRQKKALQKKAEQERLEGERQQAQLLKQDQERLKKQEIADEKQAEKVKALAQKKRDAAEASKAAAAAKEKTRKQELAKQAATAAEDAKLNKQREENLRRLTGDTSGSGGAGTAAKSQGNRGDPGYGDRIKGKIKSNTIFNVPNDLNGNPATIYEVNLLPDGTIRSLDLKKPSGVPGFDEAVKRGIEKSEPYPRDKSGQVPSSFELTYKPKD